MTALPHIQTTPGTCDKMLTRSMRASWLIIFLTFGIVGGWLATAQLDSAIVSSGVLESASSTRQIQHLEGGIVSEFFVRNGDTVKTGDLLVRFDSTQSAATVDLFNKQLMVAYARQERLQAETAMAPELRFSTKITSLTQSNPPLAEVVKSEEQNFNLQRGELLQGRQLLETNIGQSEEEVRASETRRSIGLRSAELVKADLADQRTLREKGLTSQAQVTQLEQQSLALEERIAQSDIEIARVRQAILGFRLQISQLDQEYRRRAAEQLDIVSREIRGLERDIIIATDSLDRVEIRSPVDGTVQESILGTVGAVIGSGETIMKIAPQESTYIITAQVAPNDIDGVLPGAPVRISFPAFQALDLPPSDGTLISISNDRIVDARTRASFYEARIELDVSSLPAAQRASLVAGMTASAILPTGERTALNYLLGPLTRRWQNAMREE
jgi:HlyD family type I secretion membrane fusion protein